MQLCDFVSFAPALLLAWLFHCYFRLRWNRFYVVVPLVILARRELGLAAILDQTREPTVQLMQPAPDVRADTCTVSSSLYNIQSTRRHRVNRNDDTSLSGSSSSKTQKKQKTVFWECIIWLGMQERCLSLHFCSSPIPLLLSLNVK